MQEMLYLWFCYVIFTSLINAHNHCFLFDWQTLMLWLSWILLIPPLHEQSVIWHINRPRSEVIFSLCACIFKCRWRASLNYYSLHCHLSDIHTPPQILKFSVFMDWSSVYSCPTFIPFYQLDPVCFCWRQNTFDSRIYRHSLLGATQTWLYM